MDRPPGGVNRAATQQIARHIGCTRCYAFFMTTVEIVFRYAVEPTAQVAVALARVRDVYGIRSLSFDRTARTLRIDFDATRLHAATVARLVRETGLAMEEIPPPAAPSPAVEPAAPAA